MRHLKNKGKNPNLDELPDPRTAGNAQPTRSGRRFLGTYTCLGGVTWSTDLLPTRTKLNSRAESSAWIASFTRVRGTKFARKFSTSPSSTAITQSRYFDTSAESASGTEIPTPWRTASGAQRDNSSHTEPSSTV